MTKENISKYIGYFLFGIYIIFFISIVFTLRAVSSISVGLILITGLALNHKIDNRFLYKKGFLFFLFGCSLLFIIQCLSLLYTNNITEGVKLTQRSSALIFIPFALFANRKSFSGENLEKLVFYFSIILSIASLYCLLVSLFKYVTGAPASIFFYHDLVKPISQHAIQFSIMLFIALVSLVEKSKEKRPFSPNFLLWLMVVFLSFFLILLSSKLIISFYILYLLSFPLRKRFNRMKNIAIVSVFIATVALISLTPNPVSNRFRAVFAGNSLLFTQKKFTPGIYFNGFQFRLLQWRFTYEILDEQNAWLSGLTPGDAQSFLDTKYRDTHMYTGISGTEKHGFLGYHTHNQFLQSLLENGLPGLLIFIFICYSLLKMARESKKNEMKWVVILLLIYCFTDAPLETQYGLVIFTFFPAFLYLKPRIKPERNLYSVESYRSIQFENKHGLSDVISHKQPN